MAQRLSAVAPRSTVGNYTTDVMSKQQIRECLRIPDELYPWQQLVLDIALTRSIGSRREILWVWSAKGNVGKTTLVKLLAIEHDAMLLDGSTDILHAATKYIAKLDEDEAFSRHHIFVLDISRAPDKKLKYDAIEKLRDGLWTSGRYKRKTTLIPPPQVVIFSCSHPNESAMSSYKWRIIDIDSYIAEK